MNKTIGVTELQQQFRTVFDTVVRRHVPYILTRDLRPEAVMISYDQYLKFVRTEESGIVERLDHALARMAEVNAHYTDEEVEADLQQATKTVRARRRKR